MNMLRSLPALTLLAAVAATPAAAETKFKPIQTQFVAALGGASATHGNNAEVWGLWVVDPGPRGVPLAQAEGFATQSIAPAGWAFNRQDWWLEEHGRVMEQPSFPVPPGRYLVTGLVNMAVLTIHAKGADGHMAWELSDGETLAAVTHQGCRAGRYTPAIAGASCMPVSAPADQFPVSPGAAMPPVPNCAKQDYSVLIVVGQAEEGS